MWEEQGGGLCDGNPVNERERGKRGRQEGDRAGHAQPCWPLEALGLSPGRPWSIVGRGGAGPDYSARRRPLVAATGKLDHEGVARSRMDRTSPGGAMMGMDPR